MKDLDLAQLFRNAYPNTLGMVDICFDLGILLWQIILSPSPSPHF